MTDHCPFCGHSRTDEAYLNKIKATGYKSYQFNPGGVVLIYDFKSIQIANECHKCDYDTIMEKLKQG